MATVSELLDHIAGLGSLDIIAVTEHDTLRSSDAARQLATSRGLPFDVISGMEVTTLDGHLLALWIDEPVPSFQRMEPTLEAIHRQGGLAVAPHPLSWMTRSVRRPVFERIAAACGNGGVYFDGIEEVNMSPAGRSSTVRVRELNAQLGLAALGCSDAHFLPAVGSGRTVFAGSTAADLRAAIEGRTTVAEAGRAPTMSELGYRNVAVQSVRGMLATPRAMGWSATVRSFFTSHARPPRPTSDESGRNVR
jgi:predicted metal-dependent phosphoesterase TrpH